jgi:5-methylcytosine-specific restriction protein A
MRMARWNASLRKRGILRLRTMTDYRSPEAATYRKWYKGNAWRILREHQLRDEPLCRMCQAEGRVTAANVVDHVRPHKGDRVLFFDPENLQSLCAPHHDADKQQIERIGFSTRVGLDGFPMDENHPANR